MGFSSEALLKLNTVAPYQSFFNRIKAFKSSLLSLIHGLKSSGASLSCLGASTKGNVLLQYCGLDSSLLDFVGEVNPNKFNCYTPGTKLPIIPETDLLALCPDYLLVLPWHFKDNFLRIDSIKNYRACGGKLIFPSLIYRLSNAY